MGDPFEASDARSRRTRTVDAEIKLDAAKEVLREELRELSETTPDLALAIVAFTAEATLVYEGPVAALEAIDGALAQLIAHDGTDIAAALNVAADYKEERTSSGLSQVVLISDGKSNRVEAMAAARRCLECQLALSMLLIDPTEEGTAFGREVVRAVGGTYQPVRSAAELRDAAERIAETHAASQARAEAYLREAKREAKAVEAAMAGREPVVFTAGYRAPLRPITSIRCASICTPRATGRTC